jgi:hypothetical protein
MRKLLPSFLLFIMVVLRVVRVQGWRAMSRLAVRQQQRQLFGRFYNPQRNAAASVYFTMDSSARQYHRLYSQKACHMSTTSASSTSEDSFFADTDFGTMGVRSPLLLERIQALGFVRPTAVQAASFQAIASHPTDVMVGAETGSGTYLIVLLG